MQKNTAATILVVSALISYALLRFLFPTLQIQRLIFLAFLTVAGLLLMMMHRREKNKPAS